MWKLQQATDQDIIRIESPWHSDCKFIVGKKSRIYGAINQPR